MLRIVTKRRLDELKQKEAQLGRIQVKVSMAYRWLSEFPRVCSALNWVDAVYSVDISLFRDRLRQPRAAEREISAK